MYSYEDRVRAVELFIKLGKRVRPTIRQLGYPTKNSLKAGSVSTSNVSICQWAMQAGNPSSRRLRRRRLLNTISLTTDASLPL